MILILLLTSLASFSKPYTINLDKVLKTGKFFGEVVVLRYVLEMSPDKKSNVSAMTVKLLGEKDSVFTITKLSPDDYGAYLQYGTYKPIRRAYWPSLEDTVLMALDSTFALTFFGTKTDHGLYRLYTPFFTGSATMLFSRTLFAPVKFGSQKQVPYRRTEADSYCYTWGLYATRQQLLEIRQSGKQ